jgi:hypothetical protein
MSRKRPKHAPGAAPARSRSSCFLHGGCFGLTQTEAYQTGWNGLQHIPRAFRVKETDRASDQKRNTAGLSGDQSRVSGFICVTVVLRGGGPGITPFGTVIKISIHFQSVFTHVQIQPHDFEISAEYGAATYILRNLYFCGTIYSRSPRSIVVEKATVLFKVYEVNLRK